MASVANATAVSNPKQFGRADDVVVDGLGHADERNARLAELVGDGERAVAADDDQRVEPHLVEHLDDALGVVAGAFGGGDRSPRTDCRC